MIEANTALIGTYQLQEIEEIYDEVQEEPSPPPVPPRTYNCSIQAASENSAPGKASKTFRHSKSVPSASPTDIKLERSSQHPPVKPKPDSQGMLNYYSTAMIKLHEEGFYFLWSPGLNNYCMHTAIGRGSLSLAVMQKRSTTHTEMISKNTSCIIHNQMLAIIILL